MDLQRIWDRDARKCRAPLCRGRATALEEADLDSRAESQSNHDLKNLFKSAATVAPAKPGPFQEFYAALVAKRIKPEMARLTLACKIAAIKLTVWKKGVRFDAKYLKPQTA